MKRYTFTLIEILGVIAIIGILATLGFAGYSYANGKARESATKGLITRLDAALEFAKEKSGYLPPAKDNFVTIKIDEAGKTVTIGSKTCAYNATATATKEEKMYSDFYRHFVKSVQMDSMSRFLNENNEVIDAWGNVIYFRYPGKLKTGGFDLISAGSDGVFGSEEKSAPDDDDDLSKYRSGAEWICDDIANF